MQPLLATLTDPSAPPPELPPPDLRTLVFQAYVISGGSSGWDNVRQLYEKVRLGWGAGEARGGRGARVLGRAPTAAPRPPPPRGMPRIKMTFLELRLEAALRRICVYNVGREPRAQHSRPLLRYTRAQPQPPCPCSTPAPPLHLPAAHPAHPARQTAPSRSALTCT